MNIDNVNLRPVEREDIDKLFKWRNNKEIFNQLGGGYFPVSKTEMSKWMDNFSKVDKTNVRFIVEYNKEAVGFISLTNINYINSSGELGIYIGETAHRGKGIASKALGKLEDFASRYLNLRKIKLLMNSNNGSALKLYEKKGYKNVGRYKNERFIDGEWIDVIIMEKFL